MDFPDSLPRSYLQQTPTSYDALHGALDSACNTGHSSFQALLLKTEVSPDNFPKGSAVNNFAFAPIPTKHCILSSTSALLSPLGYKLLKGRDWVRFSVTSPTVPHGATQVLESLCGGHLRVLRFYLGGI